MTEVAEYQGSPWALRVAVEHAVAVVISRAMVIVWRMGTHILRFRADKDSMKIRTA
jgi:hypothetical protein